MSLEKLNFNKKEENTVNSQNESSEVSQGDILVTEGQDVDFGFRDPDRKEEDRSTLKKLINKLEEKRE